MSPAIAPRLRDALEQVEVQAGALRATVGERVLEAETVRELRQTLANALYDVLHAGRPEDAGVQPRTLRDPELEGRLAESMPHRSTVVAAIVVADEGDDGVVVELDGVRVRIPAAALVGTTAVPGEQVALRLGAARAALSPGFFLADGSRGTRARLGATRRVYVHLAEPGAAPPAWGAILRRLEALQVGYRAKVGSSRRLFPRRDGLVVYLGPGAWHAAEELADVVAGLSGAGESVSAFAEPLAPGLATAWEPEDPRPGKRGLSFGQHRALAVAEGLVEHALARTTGSREPAVARALAEANVDAANPGRNLGSPRLSLPEAASTETGAAAVARAEAGGPS